MSQITERSIDELATEVVRLGRELERVAHSVSLGGDSIRAGQVDRTMRRLAERDPFDPRDDASIAAL